ncbi:MAG TPA: DUF4203 domain-containing protein [Terriglobales bacterium]|nr:DUF4203 domain-containing protein [Terriglobales bacterium]
MVPLNGIFEIVVGLILLLFGRKLFWLFVAITGFLFGMAISGAFFPDQPQWILVCIGLGAGLLGALLAVLAERVAFALAGFYAGSYLALVAAQPLSGTGPNLFWFLVGGIVGAVIASLIMDWAIIVLSSLVGAGAILQAIQLGQPASVIVFILLVAAGILVQRKIMT